MVVEDLLKNIELPAIYKREGKAEFLHNGQISSIKSDEIISMVLEQGDGLRVGSYGIELGTINIDKLLYLDDNDVFEMIYNFIEYALLREEVRRRKRELK